VKSSRRKDNSGLGPLDYGLMAIGNCFAVFSAGMAIGIPEVAQFFVCAILFGTAVSLLIRASFGNSKLVMIDSFLYALVALTAVFATPALNSILPGGGFQQEVSTAGWLCWMLAFGSAVSWRDRTLLFQSVPTIALFGLIGCYDTYAPAPAMFFGFLLCLATLLARSHSREMIRQAVESGYFNRADSPTTPTEFPEQSPELYEDIKAGPWKWLAGPEWALISGLAIVFTSALGAPVIRAAVQPLAGVIKVTPPKGRRAPFSPYSQGSPIVLNRYDVGRGPLFDANARPIPEFTAHLDRMRLLRTAAYETYTGHGWTSNFGAGTRRNDKGPAALAIAQMRDPQPFHIVVTPLTSASMFPLPAETVRVTGSQAVLLRQDGGGEVTDGRLITFDIDGLESGRPPEEVPKDPPAILRECLDTTGLTESVRKFANDAIAHHNHSAAEKANALRDAIGQRVTYNLLVTPVPPEQDAVDYFLNDSKSGYCDLYASAMVMCARAEGLPARYVIGYAPDASNTDDRGNTTIFDKDYHAWAEIFFKGVGWVPYDATQSSQLADSGTGFSLSQLTNLMLPNLLNILIGLTTIFLLVTWFLPSYRRRMVNKPARYEIERAYVAFQKALFRATGTRRRANQTPDEYLASVKPQLNGMGERAEKLNARLVAGLYSQHTPTEEELGQIRTEVKEFASQSRAGGAR